MTRIDVAGGITFSREEIESASTACTNSVPWPPIDINGIKRCAGEIAALGPVLVSIDVAGSDLESVRSALRVEEARLTVEARRRANALGMAWYPPPGVPLHVDDTLPLRTVRFRFSDGSKRLERLEAR